MAPQVRTDVSADDAGALEWAQDGEGEGVGMMVAGIVILGSVLFLCALAFGKRDR